MTTLFWIALSTVAIAGIVLVFYMVVAGGKRDALDAEAGAKWEAERDARLKDLIVANGIRDRVADVPERLPEPDPTKPITDRRRGRRGPV